MIIYYYFLNNHLIVLFQLCGKGFSRADYLQTHYSIHLGKRNYACSQCPRKFVRKMHLKAHEKVGYEVQFTWVQQIKNLFSLIQTNQNCFQNKFYFHLFTLKNFKFSYSFLSSEMLKYSYKVSILVKLNCTKVFFQLDFPQKITTHTPFLPLSLGPKALLYW